MLKKLNRQLISDPLALLILIFFIAACASPKSSYSPRPRTKTTKSLRTNICNTALALEGSKYKYGGKEPRKGFDCSGFTSYVMDKNGVDISGPSYTQARKGTKLDIKEVKPGDLVFFTKKGKVNHVGLVIENRKNRLLVIHSTSSQGVIIDNIWDSSYWSKNIAFGRSVID